MEDNSTVYEDYDCEHDMECDEKHANTYLEAKALGERCISLFFKQRAGQPLHQKNVRIFRLATLGPAVEFPHAGWGANWQSSPVSAILATDSVSDETLRTMVPEKGILDGELAFSSLNPGEH